MTVLNRNRTYFITCLVFFILLLAQPAFAAVMGITSVSPSSGSAGEETPITISGYNFDPSAQVTIGGVPVDTAWVNSGKLTAIAPKMVSGQIGVPQEVKVTQTVNGILQEASLPEGFTYLLPKSKPSIVAIYDRVLFQKQGVVSNSGPLGGQNEIVILGSDFQTLGSIGPTVCFGQGSSWVEVTVGSDSVFAIDPQNWPEDLPDPEEDLGVSPETIDSGIIVVAPPGNTTGRADVRVVNPDLGTFTTTIPDGWFYKTCNIAISGITPNKCSVAGEVYAVISGSNFDEDAFLGVKFIQQGSTETTELERFRIVDFTSSEILIILPPSTEGVKDLVVYNRFGERKYANAFTYTSQRNPVVEDVFPDHVNSAGGSIVTIYGREFDPEAEVFLRPNGELEETWVPEVEVAQEGTSILARIPVGQGLQAGEYDVIVRNIGFGEGILERGIWLEDFTEDIPVVESVYPNCSPTTGGIKVVINCQGAQPDAEIYIGFKKVLQKEYLGDGRFRVVVPPNERGNYYVTVTNPDGGTGVSETAIFEYRAYTAGNMRITSIAPNSGGLAGGTFVTIRGTDFRSGAQVYFGDKEATNVNIFPENESGSYRITCVTPPGDMGKVDVVVVNPEYYFGIAISENGFTYRDPSSHPVITSIEPASGPVAGGMTIKITGSDFRDGAWVFIGGLQAEGVQVEDDTTIRAVTPPHTVGPKDVTVVNYDGGSATENNGFTYYVPLSDPIITAVEPNRGPQTGGTTITITGRDFQTGAEVYIGGEPCTSVVVENYKTLTAVTPPGQVGPADVTVTNSVYSGSYTMPGGFTYIYVEPPVILGVDPNQGPSEGGTEVTIRGDHFQAGLTVTIGGSDARVNSANTNEIRIVTPGGSVGWQPVTVTNPDGGAVTLPTGFQYTRSRSAPDTPGSLEATAEDKNTVRLQWTRVEFANYFEIYMREKGDHTYRFVDQTKSDVTTYYVTGLEPGTTYYFQVRAVNEKGQSGFSATDSVRTRSGSRERPGEDEFEELLDEVNIVTGRGTSTMTVPSNKAIRDRNYTFDFENLGTQKNPVNVLQMNARVASGLQQDVVVNLTGCQLSVPPGVWNLPAVNSLTSREAEESVVRLIISDAGQREAESALAYLPKGAKVISKVYTLQMEVVSRGKSEYVDLFPYPVNVSFDVPVNKGNLRNLAVYSRNLNGSWTKASGSSVTLLKARAYTYFPTTFLLAGF